MVSSREIIEEYLEVEEAYELEGEHDEIVRITAHRLNVSEETVESELNSFIEDTLAKIGESEL